MDKLNSWHIQGDQMEGESGVIRKIIDELHSWEIQGDHMERKSMVLLEISSMNFIFAISK